MSSLLKMNQKFLSKSSWTIRGNSNSNNSNSSSSSNVNTNANSGSTSKSSANRQQNNGRFVFGQNRQKLFVNGDKAQTIESKNNRKNVFTQQSNSEQTSVRQSSMLSSNGGVNRQNNRQFTSSTPLKPSNHRPNRAQLSHTSTAALVNIDFDSQDSQSQQTSQNSFGALRRTKGMSHSITDLRELKEKPPPKKSPYAGNDDDEGFQREIFERRIDTYIAEIEMDPLFHLGSTIR